MNRFSYKGKIYRYLDNENNIVEKTIEKMESNTRGKGICVIDLISKKKYKSFRECAYDLGVSETMVRDRVYNRIKNDKLKDDFKLEILKES